MLAIPHQLLYNTTKRTLNIAWLVMRTPTWNKRYRLAEPTL